jgi:hypothetical protein
VEAIQTSDRNTLNICLEARLTELRREHTEFTRALSLPWADKKALLKALLLERPTAS